MLEQGNVDILLLQETRILHQEQMARLKKQLEAIHYVLISEFPSKYVATIVNTKKITSHGVVHSEDRLQVVRVVCGNETITIANHYGPHKTNRTHYDKITEVLSRISAAGKVLFGGDHNAVVTAEDRTSRRKDPNTKALASTLSSCNMQDVNLVLGVDRFHTYYTRTMSSRIDSAWANKAALGVICNVEAYIGNGALSDHIPTKVTLRVEHHEWVDEERTSLLFPKNRADRVWITYASQVLADLSKHRVERMSDPDEQCDVITNSLINRSIENFGRKSTKKPWGNNRRIRRLLNTRELLLRYLVNGQTTERTFKVFSHYGEPRTQLSKESVWIALSAVDRKLHGERVRNSNKKFRTWEWAARTSEFVNPTKFFSAASAKKANRIRLNTVNDGNMTCTDSESVGEKAACYFESAFSKETADMSYLRTIPAPSAQDTIRKEFTQITTEEVRDSIGWLRNKKCPGPDGVHNEMLKLPRTDSRDYSWELSEILSGFFNNILESGSFPNRWKECTIVPAYKKGDAQDISNYRPICLLSALSKLFTRLLNARVSKAAEAASLFTNTQGGGRKFRDIREKLSIMRGVIDHANRNDGQLYLLLTDIAKAFDSVPHNAIKEVYSFFGFPEHIVNLVHDMVTGNGARVMAGKLSRRFLMGKGTRQGDSLSPTTYVLVHQTVLMYTAGFAKGYEAMSQDIWNVAYVDDCNLMSNNREAIEKTANKMNEVLSMLRMVMHPNKLELYVRKMGRSSSVHNITVNNVVVPANGSEKTFRALGLFTSLNGCTTRQKEQALEKVKRVVNRLGIMRLTARQVARIINTCIHPVFLYACEFTHWTKAWINRVNQMGKALIKQGSVAMKRYPSDLLQVSCDNGGFGLRKIEESILVRTAWFVKDMLRGKNDNEAHKLMLDSLEEIKLLQTFQRENVFQSNNRLELVKHTYLKWCAERMHNNNLTISYGDEVNCLSCNLAMSQPNDVVKKFFKIGVSLKEQLTRNGKWVKHGELVKAHGKFGISAKRYGYILMDLELLQCNGTHDRSAATLPILMYKDNFEVVEKKQIWHAFTRQYRDLIGREKLWWIQKACLGGATDFSFMKCPFRVDRKLEWFIAQVKSQTLHTKAVVKHLYGVEDMDTACPKCNFEQETVLHCLVNCPVARMARILLSKEVSKRLSSMGLHKSQCVDIWFDNQQWCNGKRTMNEQRKTGKDYLIGMLGVETQAIKQVAKGLKKSGIKKEVAKLKAKRFVDNTKRRCVEVMHRLFTSSKNMAGC